MHYIPAENLHMVRTALVDFPRPDTQAEALLSHWLTQQNIDVAPDEIDVVTLHYQLEPLGEGRAHFRENAVISQKMSLPEALLSNWQGEPASGYGGFHYGDWAGVAPAGELTLVERLEPESELSSYAAYSVFNGLYRRTDPPVYNNETRLKIRAEDFQAFIWSLQYHTRYKDSLARYWSARLPHYERALKINFIAACNLQVQQHSLCDEARQLIWQIAELIPRSSSACTVSMLNVYGYVSTSILCLRTGHSDLTVLYIPGNASPFLEFRNEAAMKHWFTQQCQDPARREALLQMFACADWPDGLDYSGLRTALAGLGLYPHPHRFSPQHPGFATSGLWSPDMVNYRNDHYSPPIETELFGYLARRQQQRSLADADSQIVSNHQIDKAHWSSYLNVALAMLAPVAMVLPGVAPLLAIGGLVQFGLGLDQAIHGRSLEEKAAGVDQQLFGLFNAVPLAGNALVRPATLFRYCRPGFTSFRALLSSPEQAGEVISLEEPPLLPAQAAFRDQPVLTPSSTAAVVTRVDGNLRHRFAAWIDTEEGLVNDWVLYELENDSFIRVGDVRSDAPPRWIVSQRYPVALSRLSEGRREASDAQRMASLRALGIQLDLPLDYGPYAALTRTPIKRLITSLWVGDRRLESPFLDAIEHNAQALENSDYQYQLLLSRQDAATFEHNRSVLAKRAPRLQVVPLEDQPFFDAFQHSPYHDQYQAALVGDGNGAGNFSSASDILRYRALSHYGGLYMDADDTLLLPESADSALLPLDSMDLRCSADGLLLSAPVSNDQLGMYIKYNNSLVGSHPGNPTLDALSDEILRRYRLEPGFYSRRPSAALDPAGFTHYIRRLSLLTGPGVLNDVVDQHLPWLRQLREICNLLVSPTHDAHRFVDLKKFIETLQEQVPLGEVADIGRAHSWMHD